MHPAPHLPPHRPGITHICRVDAPDGGTRGE